MFMYTTSFNSFNSDTVNMNMVNSISTLNSTYFFEIYLELHQT